MYISKVLEKVIKKRAGLTQGQPTQTISKDIILPKDDIKQSNRKNNPDKDISNNTARQVMAVDSDRAVPEQRRQCPGIRTGDGGQVHESRQAAVAPVGDCLVDKVGDEDDLRAPEVVAGPKEDPSGEEKVV